MPFEVVTEFADKIGGEILGVGADGFAHEIEDFYGTRKLTIGAIIRAIEIFEPEKMTKLVGNSAVGASSERKSETGGDIVTAVRHDQGGLINDSVGSHGFAGDGAEILATDMRPKHIARSDGETVGVIASRASEFDGGFDEESKKVDLGSSVKFGIGKSSDTFGEFSFAGAHIISSIAIGVGDALR